MLKKIILGVAAVSATAVALPASAEARGYRDRYYSRSYQNYDPYYRGSYYNEGYRDRAYYGRSYGYRDRYYGRRSYRRCGSGTTGAIIGGAAGALLGREVARSSGRGYYRYRRGGNGTVGALIGGAAGALIGREIGRSC